MHCTREIPHMQNLIPALGTIKLQPETIVSLKSRLVRVQPEEKILLFNFLSGTKFGTLKTSRCGNYAK